MWCPHCRQTNMRPRHPHLQQIFIFFSPAASVTPPEPAPSPKAFQHAKKWVAENNYDRYQGAENSRTDVAAHARIACGFLSRLLCVALHIRVPPKDNNSKSPLPLPRPAQKTHHPTKKLPSENEESADRKHKRADIQVWPSH
jgi:hypothetical protein